MGRQGLRQNCSILQVRTKGEGMNAEKLAYWFFRLNGCFTFENFIVHPDRHGSQETDADLIAVRFQHRRELELSGRPMLDYPLFAKQPTLISAYLVEAKRGPCALNGPWTNSERQNLQRVLYAMGFLPRDHVPEAANALYRNLRYEDDLITIQFVAVGREQAEQGPTGKAEQLIWDDMLTWIHNRFNDYSEQKRHHPQWDGSGRKLFRSATQKYHNDRTGFVVYWLQTIGVATEH